MRIPRLTVVTHFVEHEPCPTCGSRDNLARYSDGGAFCFGCGRWESGSHSPHYSKDDSEDSEETLKLPWDCTMEYEDPGLAWAMSYGVNAATLMENTVYWCPSRQQLIFTWWDKSEALKPILLAYQARNFKEGQKKYISQGDLSTLLPIYRIRGFGKPIESDLLVIVEDCISAMKVSHLTSDAMPCLSSDLSPNKMAWISKLYKRVVIWLDGNMYVKAQKLSDQLSLLGVSSSVIYTPKDPKEYRYQQIHDYVTKL